MKFITLGLCLLSLSTSHAAIFGTDDRELLTTTSSNQVQASATAIAVLSSLLEVSPTGKLSLITDELVQFCKDEKLVSGPSLGFSCTGFLVGPNLLATAGHCVYAVNNPGKILKNETEKACKVFTWLFDHKVDADGKLNTTDIDPSKMYRCKRIIYAANRESSKPFDDYALIELDRPVVGRTPYKISTAKIGAKEELRMIGFPFGTSMKLTTNGKVILDNPARQSLITDLDAFEGNSGSPVFNTKDEVIGILVGGTPSSNFYFDGRSQCDRLNRCDQNRTNCMEPDDNYSKFPGFQTVGSEVQRIKPIADLMKRIRRR